MVNRSQWERKAEGEKDGREMHYLSEQPRNVRATMSFPVEFYVTYEETAKRKKVSLAWVVRDAAQRYLADTWPPFGKRT